MATQTQQTPAGVTVALDESADVLTVTAPADATLPQAFVRACHELAGEAGACIRFVRS